MKFSRIAETMLGILSIPRGNAECERQFSVVRKTRMQFRCSVCDKTLGNVLTTKCQKNGPFYSQTYSEEFLKKAKSAAPKCLQKCLLDSGAVVCKCGNKNANNLSACEFSVAACLAFGDAKAYGLTPTILGQEGMDNRGVTFWMQAKATVREVTRVVQRKLEMAGKS